MDPTVSDPWQLLEPCAVASTVATPTAGGDAVPRGAHKPEGESPSNPTGVNCEIKFWGTSIYEFDAESPIGERVEDSPTPLAIPDPAGLDLGGGSMPANRRTSHAVDNRLAPSDGCCALVAAHRAAQLGFPPPISNTPGVLAGGSAGDSHARPSPAAPQAPAPVRAGVHVSLGDRTGLLCPPGTTAGVPHRDGVPGRSPGEHRCPESAGAGGRSPMDAGRLPPLWESRLQDLERDLGHAQATCQALSSEQDRRLQELQRVRADLHRSAGELASMRRDHSTVSGELVRQRSCTRSLEEEGSSLRRQLADAQRAARDVAGAMDERLSRHLPAILEAVQIVRDEHISQPSVERALRGWVPAGYGPPSTANPNFREICATLVCAAVLRVAPPPSLEQLSRRLRVPVQPVLHFPTEAVGQDPLPGLSADTRPMGRASTPHEGPETSSAVRSAGKPVVALTPGNRSGGDTTPTAAEAAGATTPTPGRDEIRALLVYLNEVPPDWQTGEAQKLHLHLATRLDLPPEFPQSNLRAQYTALGRLLPTRPELGHLVGEFARDRRAEPSGTQTPAPDSQGAAKVAAASRANQAGGSGKSPGRGKGGSDYDTYSLAVMVRWCVNPRDTPEAIYPLSLGRLGMVLKKAFRDFRVSYIKDEGQLCHTEDEGWALVGVRPEAASALEGGGGDADKQFTYEWAKANKQLYSGGLLRAHHVEKSNAVLQRMRSGDLMAGPKGLIRAPDRDGAGDEGPKRRRSPSWSPPRASHRSEGDYTPRWGSRYPSPEDDYRRGGSRHTPQSVGGPWDGRYNHRAPSRGEQPRQPPQWLPRDDRWGQDYRSYDPPTIYGERSPYPRPEMHPVSPPHQAASASPPATAAWGAPPVDPCYPGDCRAPHYGPVMPPQGMSFPQAPYQHPPYGPPAPTADATAPPSGYMAPWYGELVPAPAATAWPGPVNPVAPPTWGPSP